MKILELELIGYSRFSLKQINYLKITPVEKNQMILGTNGSGKSSLIEEMTPLPALSSKYTKDGSKYVKISHRGKIYEMKSVFSPTQRHSFVVDGGENLNQGGTLTAQKELVRQHLGVTQEIHEMLTGLRKLTDMSPLERRSWFTAMSDTDYEYAISFYQKLKEKARDLTGAIKLTSARLATETAKLSTDEETKATAELVKKLRQSQETLTAERKFLKRPLALIRSKLATLSEDRDRISKTLSALKVKLVTIGSSFNYSSDTDKLASLEREANSLRAKRDLVLKEISKKKSTLEELARTDIANSDSIDLEIKRLSQEKVKENSSIRNVDITIANPTETNICLESIRQPITDIVLELRHNSDDYFSRENISSKRKVKEELLEKLKLLTTNLEKTSRLLEKQEELKNTRETQCPKCKHGWVIGYDEESYKKLTIEKEELQVSLVKLTAELKIIEEYIEDFEIYLRDSKCLISFFDQRNSNYQYLSTIWNHATERQLIKNDPKSFLRLVDDVIRDNEYRIRVSEIDKRMNELNDLKSKFSGITSNDILRLKTDVKDLEAEYSNLNLRLNEVDRDSESLTNVLDIMNRAKSELDRVELIENENTELKEELIQGLMNEALTKALEKIKSDLTKAEDRERRILSQRDLVKSLGTDLESYRNELNTTNKMLKSLSPTDGLIAKGLIGFMDVFMKQMNSFISKIWLYDLRIEPCKALETDTVGLSYTFPVSIDGKIVSPDVAKTSKGMSEILNLAFRVVAMRYLNMSDYMLVLDEFSSNMDEAHKKSAFAAISTLMSHSDFEQLYIVSHFYHSYGGMKGADVCVLCDANITIPDGCNVNKHVVIK